MQCTNCGNQVPDTAKVCGYCGHRLKDTAPVVPVPAAVPVKQSGESQVTNKFSIISLVIGILGLIWGGISTVLTLPNTGKYYGLPPGCNYYCIMFAIFLVGVVISMTSYIQIKRSGGNEKGLGLAIAGFVLCAIGLAGPVFIVLTMQF